MTPTQARFSFRDLRDGRLQNRLAGELRDIDQGSAMCRLRELSEVDFPTTLKLSRRVVHGRARQADFARQMLLKVNPSTVDDWIAQLRPMLGWDRLMAILEEDVEADPTRAKWALYFLPSRAAGDPTAEAAVDRLSARLAHAQPQSAAAPG